MKTNSVETYKENLINQISDSEKELDEIEVKVKELWNRTSSLKNATKDEDDSFYKMCRKQESLKNFIEKSKKEVLPTDQKYFSQLLYTDVHAYKCVKEFTPNKVGIVRLKAEVTKESRQKLSDSFVAGGFCGHTNNSLQEWKFEMPEFTEDDIVVIRKHKDGYWYDNNKMRYGLFDHPYEYYDYNF